MSQALYSSPRGLYQFQADDVARCLLRPSALAVWDCGTGKSHLSMATSAMLYEDREIDLVIVVCEKSKIDEWYEDFCRFTRLDVRRYRGAPAERRKLLLSLGERPVLIGTYETIRNDSLLMKRNPKTSRMNRVGPGFLNEAIKHRRVMLAYDEATRIGSSRTSQTYESHKYLADQIRKYGSLKSVGLTATPVDRSPENLFNIGRIICPDRMPTVAEFDRLYIAARDFFSGKPTKFQNLTPETSAPGVVSLTERFNGVLLRRRKTDPDIIDQFPAATEEFTHLRLTDAQQDFYEAVLDAFDDAEPDVKARLFQTMRQIAAHPLSLLSGDSSINQAIVAEVGIHGLAKLGSAKTDALVEYLSKVVVGQGSQAVVFTFFGPSVIPLLGKALDEAEISWVPYHGGVPDDERQRSRAAFAAGDAQVFLSSDAGARGINLPEATYAIEYELGLSQAMRTQRMNRISRIGQGQPRVTFQSFVALDTVEEGIEKKVVTTNEWSDLLIETGQSEGDFISATDRRAMLAASRRRSRIRESA